MPYYSFVLLCYNNWGMTNQALTTLLDSFRDVHKQKGIELIIVNNGSVDETKAALDQMGRFYNDEIEIVPVHLKENMGYTVGLNMGLAKCRGEINTVINNDLVFPVNWFDGIVKTLESDPSIGMVGPFLSYGSGPENAGVAFHTLDEMRVYAKQFMEDNKDRLIESNRILGACMTFRKKVLATIGGNDFWFGVGQFDDDDLSIRTGIAGYKLVITGASFVHHYGSQTYNQQGNTMLSALSANERKFIKKWSKTGYGFHERNEMIKSTHYSKNEHYFPLNIDDFNQKSPMNSELGERSMILVADWINNQSEWRNKLINIKNQQIVNQENHLYIWIPKTYYPEHEVVQGIEQTIGGQFPNLHYIFDEVYPQDIQLFLWKYHEFIEVESDYINRFFKYVYHNTSIQI